MRTYLHLTEEHRRHISEGVRGEKHPMVKLTLDQVHLLYAQKGVLSAPKACALVEGIVCPNLVYAIWNGKAWGHVTGQQRASR